MDGRVVRNMLGSTMQVSTNEFDLKCTSTIKPECLLCNNFEPPEPFIYVDVLIYLLVVLSWEWKFNNTALHD